MRTVPATVGRQKWSSRDRVSQHSDVMDRGDKNDKKEAHSQKPSSLHTVRLVCQGCRANILLGGEAELHLVCFSDPAGSLDENVE